MYWICLTEEELDDTISAINGFMQYDYFDGRETEKFMTLSDKLQFFRDHDAPMQSQGQKGQEGA